MNQRALRAFSASLVVLTLTACGSRADFSVLDASGTAADGSSVISSEPGATAAPGSTTVTTGPSAGPTRAATGGAVLPGTTGGGGTSATGGATGAVGTTTGAGSVAKAPIRMVYIVQGSAGASALTGSSISSDSEVGVRTMTALVDYANAHGGVGGRKISATAQKSEATSQQTERLALCKHITEDLKAQIVFDQNQYLSEEGWSCFAQHKTGYFGTVTATDSAYLNKVAPYVNTTWLSLDRSMLALVNGAKATGYFTGGKVGAILADDPTMHRLADTLLKPALTDAGVKNPTFRYIGGSDPASQQAQTNSAELAFASAGINRVLFFHNILPYLSFTNQAESQGYHPRYAFSDYQGMTGVAAFYGKPAQNKDALGVSSTLSGVLDDASHKSTDTTSKIDRKTVPPATRRCLDLLTKQTGKDYYDPQESGDTLASWDFYCDEFFAWWESAKAIGPSWTPSQLGVGLRTLGKGYLTTLHHSNDWGAGRHDGASSYRVGSYQAKCTCFVKTSDWLPI